MKILLLGAPTLLLKILEVATVVKEVIIIVVEEMRNSETNTLMNAVSINADH